MKYLYLWTYGRLSLRNSSEASYFSVEVLALECLACSRLSVSRDDQKSGCGMSGICLKNRGGCRNESL